MIGFADSIGERVRAEHTTIAARWFERLVLLLPVDATEVFPSSSLLDHIPSLVVDIADYLQAPEEEAIAANTVVLEKARELGTLRHQQRASLHQLLREYQLLGTVLVDFVRDETTRLGLAPTPAEGVTVASRLHQAVNVLMQTTVETFVGLYTRTITEQAERLDEFTRMATHEWRQPLGSLQFAISLVRDSPLTPEQTRQALDVMDRNLAHLIAITRKIEILARLRTEPDDPAVQEVSLTTVAREAARQLQEMAEARAVELRITDGLPTISCDVGRLELALVNLLSNGIKYADGAKSDRFVEIVAGAADEGAAQIVVRDNGIGIPAARLSRIFDKFSRAHAERDGDLRVAGLGLGLSIVADCARSLGGRIEVESEERVGSSFILTLPLAPSH